MALSPVRIGLVGRGCSDGAQPPGPWADGPPPSDKTRSASLSGSWKWSKGKRSEGGVRSMANTFGSTGKYDMHAINKARGHADLDPSNTICEQAVEFETWFERKVGELYGEDAKYEVEVDAIESLLYVEVEEGIQKIENELRPFAETLDCREALEGSQKFRTAAADDDLCGTYSFLMATQMKLQVGKD
eukprot:764589-Hanusia_phi.AAC.2